MTEHTDTDDAFVLLGLADPVPVPPTTGPDDVARVVDDARTRDVATLRRMRPGAPRQRVVVAVAGVAVAAVSATVTVVLLTTGGGHDVPPPAAVSPPSAAQSPAAVRSPTTAPPTASHATTSPPVAVDPPVTTTDPVVLLRAASSAAVAISSAPPRPDQFLYVSEDNGYQAWMSMDGTHDGLIIPTGTTDRIVMPGCRDGVATQVGQDGATSSAPCTPEPAYRPDIPSDPAALQRWLVETGAGDSTNNVAKQVLGTLEFDYLTPATRGALYTVLAGYEGLTVVDVPSEPDAVGVTWSYGGGSVTLVFGRADHAYRGLLTSDSGYVDGSRSVVVDAVGQTG